MHLTDNNIKVLERAGAIRDVGIGERLNSVDVVEGVVYNIILHNQYVLFEYHYKTGVEFLQ